MKADIDLYESSADRYDEFQMLRPDYADAKKAFLELATKHLKDKKHISLIDFCSGTGADTKLLAENISISQATLIDINKEFLEIAKNSNIKTNIKTIVSDILVAGIRPEADVVISMFAYHHISDDKKAGFIKKMKEALKPGGIVLLGEIYMPDKATTIEYYKQLYGSISEKSPMLEKFLMQTAQSEGFEYKVSKEFADRQLADAGFELLESRKIWPKEIDNKIGTFVEVWQVK
jgi:ubiquinone/menaquinone biosynthesis C-methylase UbiE